MPNEWKVLKRAVDRFDLDYEQREEYVQVVTDVYGEAMASTAGFEEFDDEYYEFLN